MRRSIGAAVSAIVLGATLLALTPGTALAAWTCGQEFAGYHDTGRAPLTSSGEQGVSAVWTMPTAHDFSSCVGSPTVGAPGAWVAITPDINNTGSDGTWPIIRFGVASKSGSPWYFYSVGGCNFNGFDGIWLSAADWNPHKYRIDVYTGQWIAYRDGVEVRRGDANGTAAQQADWNRVSCWAAGGRDFEIAGSRVAYGDDLGQATTGGFSEMKRKYSNAWFDLGGTTCEITESNYSGDPHAAHCSANGTVMDVWTP